LLAILLQVLVLMERPIRADLIGNWEGSCQQRAYGTASNGGAVCTETLIAYPYRFRYAQQLAAIATSSNVPMLAACQSRLSADRLACLPISVSKATGTADPSLNLIQEKSWHRSVPY
jgi:hypothetical protein